jgi:hypothetical protein
LVRRYDRRHLAEDRDRFLPASTALPTISVLVPRGI